MPNRTDQITLRAHLTICLFLVGLLSHAPRTDAAPLVSPDGIVQLPRSVETLNQAAVFTFAVVSDHKGLSPNSSPIMKHCVDQIAQLNARFVVGLGDHLVKGRKNPFLTFIKSDPFWSRHFYPNVADGENAYYGTGQDHWGAGGKLLSHLAMSDWPEVRIRPNGCEYYARIPVENYVIHLVQLHYGDSPLDPVKAFREDSRAYLMTTLDAIDKQPDRDLIVLAAHTGDWLRTLSDDRRNAVLQKADLVIGATTHFFTKYSHGNTGPLVINSGAVGFARRFPKKLPLGSAVRNYNGYLSVHVLADPLALLVQYQRVEPDAPILQIVEPRFGCLKIIGGKTFPLRFRQQTTSAPADKNSQP